MNVKTGDRAIIIMGHNAGKIVTVGAPIPIGTKLKIGGRFLAITRKPAWYCVSDGLPIVYKRKTGERHEAKHGPIPDRVLKPLPELPISEEDETRTPVFTTR